MKEYKFVKYEHDGQEVNKHINDLAKSGWTIHSQSTAGIPMGGNEEGYWITTVMFERELKRRNRPNGQQ